MDKKLFEMKTFVAFVVTIVWAGSVFAEIMVLNYNTPTAIHGLMGLIAGYFYKGYLDRGKSGTH